MLSSLLICFGLLAAGPERPTADEWKAYTQARTEAGRDSEAHVRLALWCEQHGLTSRRLEHLALALMADPANTTARGLMGLIRDANTWRKPEQVAERWQADADRAATLAEYNARRAKTPMTAHEQFQLAAWCEQQDLMPEAIAHFSAVVRLDPSNAEAWRRLGCKKHKGRWMTPEQVKASVAEAEAQAKADRTWGPKLSLLKACLRSPDPERRDRAERELVEVIDPRAVPAVWKVFVAGKDSDPARAAQILAQIDARAASKALAALSVYASQPEARRMAGESLVWRDPREFLELLILQIHKPLRYEVRPLNGPGSQGELFVEGLRYNLKRTYSVPKLPNSTTSVFDASSVDPRNRTAILRAQMRRMAGPMPTPGEVAVVAGLQQAAANPATALANLGNVANGGTNLAGLDSFSLRANQANLVQAYHDEMFLERAEAIVARNINEVRKSVASAAQQLEHDVAQVEATNTAYRQLNGRVLPLLQTVTGQDLGEDPEAWERWWTDQQGYAYQFSSTKPTFVQNIPAYQPELIGLHHSCFAAGTSVRTIDGTKPIESIQVGDLVLSQDVNNGSLSFEPVVAVFHNAPNETFRVRFADQSVVATGIHRFWKAGQGWTMTRDLKPGDTIRTVGGLARVDSVETERVQPVFNLEVTDSHSFFVGGAGYLVHDNSLIETVDQPFDASPTLALSPKEHP